MVSALQLYTDIMTKQIIDSESISESVWESVYEENEYQKPDRILNRGKQPGNAWINSNRLDSIFSFYKI